MTSKISWRTNGKYSIKPPIQVRLDNRTTNEYYHIAVPAETLEGSNVKRIQVETDHQERDVFSFVKWTQKWFFYSVMQILLISRFF